MSEQTKGEISGGKVTYYSVEVTDPARSERPPYVAEAQDIIEALGMTFNEGEAFKSIWRCAAARTLGVKKLDDSPIRNAEKVCYYGPRMLVEEKRRATKAGVQIPGFKRP
jgi:hypothetical protein